MLSEIEQFQKWLRRKAPHSSTHIHYVSDLELVLHLAAQAHCNSQCTGCGCIH